MKEEKQPCFGSRIQSKDKKRKKGNKSPPFNFLLPNKNENKNKIIIKLSEEITLNADYQTQSQATHNQVSGSPPWTYLQASRTDMFAQTRKTYRRFRSSPPAKTQSLDTLDSPPLRGENQGGE